MALAALIFDIDGTVSETEELHRRAFNDVFADVGLPWHWDIDLYRDLLDVAGGKERLAHFIATHAESAPDVASRIAELHAAKTARYAALIAGGAARLRPGIARLMRQAEEAGLRLAIATTTSLPNVEALLCATLGPGAVGRFAVIGAGDMVAAKKPAPDIYQYVLDAMALPPGACVAFEDSANGLVAARAAGLPTLVTPSLYTAHQIGTGAFEDALATVSDLGEPDAPYRHIAGAGRCEGMVTIEAIERWLDRPA
ncbi:HAD-IA family hydrolase [Blastochloris tepida]|uniref:Phosphatase n=1 Tax=Blastochloris tepida TaxID=2233851 RepID=A0A348G016_9HYPH|nr:HAD-IA family hydrolase [Blastochloris tepida]BBF92899.1 phosphatase [Blastochloris tepida]